MTPERLQELRDKISKVETVEDTEVSQPSGVRMTTVTHSRKLLSREESFEILDALEAAYAELEAATDGTDRLSDDFLRKEDDPEAWVLEEMGTVLEGGKHLSNEEMRDLLMVARVIILTARQERHAVDRILGAFR